MIEPENSASPLPVISLFIAPLLPLKYILPSFAIVPATLLTSEVNEAFSFTLIACEIRASLATSPAITVLPAP